MWGGQSFELWTLNTGNLNTNALIKVLDKTRMCSQTNLYHMQGRQKNFWAPGQKETWTPSCQSPNNDTQTKSTTVCHEQGISMTKMN